MTSSIRDFFQQSPELISAFRVLTFLGSWTVLALIVIACSVYLIRRHRLPDAVFLAATWISGELVSAVLKILIGKARPDLEYALVTVRSYAFPSGHTMAITVVCGALLILWRPRGARLVAGVLVAGTVIATVALSRIALGVHDLVDIAGGFALALMWLAICVWIRARFRARRHTSR